MQTNRMQPIHSAIQPGGAICRLNRVRPVFPRALALAATALCLLAVLPAQALTNNWVGGADLNWSSPGNWSGGLLPAYTNDVYFGNTGANASSPPLGTPNNVVDAATTLQSLFYTNNTGYHITALNRGVTVTITNGSVVGNVAFGTIPTALFVGTGVDGSKTPYTTIQGAGAALVINAPGAIVNARQGSATYNASAFATLDLSLLDTFTAQISRMLAGGDGYNSNPNQRAAGAIWLANTNYIDCTSTTAWGLIVGYTPSGNSAPPLSTVYLGKTNTLLTDYGILVGGRNNTGTLKYHPNGSYGPGSGTLFRNRAGTGQQSYWQIGDEGMATAYSSGGGAGTVDFSLAPVDALVDQLLIGRAQPFANSSVYGAGSWGKLTFAAGKIEVNNAVVGYRPTVNGCPGGGQVYVNGTARLIINNSLMLGVAGATTNTAIPSTGALFVNGGSVTVGGNITDGFGPTNIISVANGGSLTLKGFCGSAPTASEGPVANLSLDNCTFTIDRGMQPNPLTAICTVSNLTTSPAVSLKVLGTGMSRGQFALISYQSWTGGFTDFAPRLAATVQGYVSNNVANKSIDLVVTNPVSPPLASQFASDVSSWQASHTYYFAGVGDSIIAGHGGAVCGGAYAPALEGGPSGNTNMNLLNKVFLLGGARGTNCGHGNYTWSNVLATAISWATNSDAKYVLCHCGVNDISQGFAWATASNNMYLCLLACRASGKAMVLDEIFPDGNTSWTDAQALAVRQWNANYHAWGAAYHVPVMISHDLMGQTRASTGCLDDLKYAYSSSGGPDVHLCVSGVNVWATNIVSFFNQLLTPTSSVLTGAALTPSDAFQFAFANSPGLSFSALGTTNVALDPSVWTPLGLATETPVGSGCYQFADAQASNSPQRFYRIRSP
jgi:hypothetical protein